MRWERQWEAFYASSSGEYRHGGKNGDNNQRTKFKKDLQKRNCCRERMLENMPDGQVMELLDYVGLTGQAEKKVKKFSLGMKQRLALARAMLGQPKLIILDEPANGLDPQGQINLYRLICDMAKERNTTFIVPSHQLPSFMWWGCEIFEWSAVIRTVMKYLLSGLYMAVITLGIIALCIYASSTWKTIFFVLLALYMSNISGMMCASLIILLVNNLFSQFFGRYLSFVDFMYYLYAFSGYNGMEVTEKVIVSGITVNIVTGIILVYGIRRWAKNMTYCIPADRQSGKKEINRKTVFTREVRFSQPICLILLT